MQLKTYELLCQQTASMTPNTLSSHPETIVINEIKSMHIYKYRKHWA